MPTRISASAQNAMADGVADLLDAGAAAGTIKVYSGTQPAGTGTAPSGTLLATFTLNDPAFGSASSGAAALSGVPLSATAAATGTAGWFRAADSDGNAVVDGTVGTSGAQLNLNTLSITTGGTVQITSGSLTAPAA